MNKQIIEQELQKNAQTFLETNDRYKKDAFLYFKEHGLPEKTAPLFSPRFMANIAPMKDSADITEETVDPRGVISFVNGIYFPEKSTLPTGLIINQAPDTSTNFNDSYDALNALASHSTLSLIIKKNTILDFPITIVHSVSEIGVNKIISPRIAITVEENAEATILENFTSNRPELFQYTTNAFTSFQLHSNAKVEHIKFSNEAKNSLHLGWTVAELARDASFYSTVFEQGQTTAAHHLKINLNDKGAETSANSLFTLSKNEKTNIITTINHKYSHTASNQLCKGILKDESFGIFNGSVNVFPDAQEITSSQLNKNLLLSKKAHIETKPQMLISADDVKCSHGATVGQLSEEETFYLESRGIKNDRAKELLINGFSNEIVFLIKNPQVRNFCEKKIK